MALKKSPIEKAAGQLISAIQKEWGKELGEYTAEVSEEVIGKGHELLKATKSNEVSKEFGVGVWGQSKNSGTMICLTEMPLAKQFLL